MASAFLCPDCGAPLANRSLVELVCHGCGRGFWLLGAQLRRRDGSSVDAPRSRRPTPQNPASPNPASPNPASPNPASPNPAPQNHGSQQPVPNEAAGANDAQRANAGDASGEQRGHARTRDPASVRGMRAGLDCPDCRAELLQPTLGVLHCPGCGAGFWMRGAEVIREGETDAVVLPDRALPKATLRVRTRDAATRSREGRDDDDDRES